MPSWTMYLGRSSFSEFKSPQKQVIHDLISGKISSKSAAEAITLHISHDPNVETNLNSFWGVLFAAIRVFPEAQEALVELLVAIVRFPAPVDNQGRKLEIYDQVIWEDLPMFYWEISSEWNSFGGPQKAQDLSTDEMVTVWSRINQFSALLVQSDVPIFQDLLSSALTSIEQGLEHPIEGDYVEAIKWLLPGALVWFKVVGRKIHATYGSESKSPGPLWNGYGGYCHARWLFWKARLVELSRDERLHENLRNDAAAVVPWMNVIEQMRKPRWTYAD